MCLAQSTANAWNQIDSQSSCDTEDLILIRLALMSDGGTFDRLLIATLNLRMSQRVRHMHFLPEIVERCWRDQLRIKGKL